MGDCVSTWRVRRYTYNGSKAGNAGRGYRKRGRGVFGGGAGAQGREDAAEEGRAPSQAIRRVRGAAGGVRPGRDGLCRQPASAVVARHLLPRADRYRRCGRNAGNLPAACGGHRGIADQRGEGDLGRAHPISSLFCEGQRGGCTGSEGAIRRL